MFDRLFSQPRNQKVAILLALVGTVTPFGSWNFSLSGLHKIYLGQPGWGVVYLLLGFTPIPRIACAIETIWFFFTDSDTFARRFAGENSWTIPSLNPETIAQTLRELESLRQEGLVSEYEFEQKRRQLLEKL